MSMRRLGLSGEREIRVMREQAAFSMIAYCRQASLLRFLLPSGVCVVQVRKNDVFPDSLITSMIA